VINRAAATSRHGSSTLVPDDPCWFPHVYPTHDAQPFDYKGSQIYIRAHGMVICYSVVDCITRSTQASTWCINLCVRVCCGRSELVTVWSESWYQMICGWYLSK